MSRFDDPEYWSQHAGPRWVRVSALVDRAMEPVTARLLAASGVGPGDRALDVGCGTGGTTAALAERVSPGGSVLAVDISKPMLELAREQLGDRAELVCADAQTHRFEPGSRDAAISRFGVMFFKDATAAFVNIGQALVAGGQLAFVCWQPLDRSPWIAAPLEAAGDLVEPPELREAGQPGPYCLADPDTTAAVLGAAGFADISIDALELDLEHRAEPEAVLELYTQIGPLARAIEPLEAPARAEALARVRAMLERRRDGDTIALGAAMWLVRARWP